jgi:phage shock protein C
MTGRDNPLYRSRTDRMIAGVCGGLARWLGWSPTVVRVLYVALSVLSAAFPGILIYLLLWIVMPQEVFTRDGEPVGSSFR